MLIRLVLRGQPVSGKNSKDGFVITKRDGFGREYQRAVVRNSKAVTRWYNANVPELARQFAAFGIPTLKGFVRVDLFQFVENDLLANRSPDGDNVQSAVWDALEKAHVILNDKLVADWGGTRRQDPTNPRVEIEIRTLTLDDLRT